jgi:hypothetical protein
MVTFGGIKCIEKEKNKKRWFVKFVNVGMYMEQLGILIFTKVVDPCFSVLKN